MGRVMHFEIHTSDPQRTIAFYTAIFGWKFDAWGPPGMYWTIATGDSSEPGINGGLVPRKGAGPVDGQAVNAFVCTVGVDDVDATVKKAMAEGAELALPKMAIPTIGWLAYFKDTEGNILGVMQPDSNAK